MSSKRGRKRNDNLPPNRARDVQRAFRARRAAHLQALEDRVAELEEENDNLRAALNLPPATRPLLGRGPTGKDKPKPYDRTSATRDQSVLGEGSASPRTTTSSPPPGSHRIASTSQTVASGQNQGMMWEGAITMAQPDEFVSDREAYSDMAANAPSTSTSYTPDLRFDPQSSRARSSFPSTSFHAVNTSGYHHSADRASNAASNFTKEEPFYSMTTVQSAGGNRTMSHSSPSVHPHSIPHHMESAMGGAAHNPMGSHGTSFSPASPAPTPNNPNMAINLRRSMNDPQHVPSYVDPYSSASYQQRAHAGIPHQSHNNVNTATTNPRLPPGHAGVSRTGFTGTELSPSGESSFRRTA
ncbi:hypothetical protein ACEPAG_7215 [Sanghuangporus baumii]